MTTAPALDLELQTFTSAGGAQIFQIPLLAFPGLWGYAYLVLALLQEPHTMAEVSQALFGEVHGYNVLLALEEAGAHVEYLYQRGLLGVENLEEVGRAVQPLPVRYRCLPCS